jgi:hypothetical protein
MQQSGIRGVGHYFIKFGIQLHLHAKIPLLLIESIALLLSNRSNNKKRKTRAQPQ